MASALFVVAYNVSVFLAIMPLLFREFDANVGYVQSILVLFSLVTAAFAPTAENLCRFFGRSRVFTVSVALYAAGTAATAFSPTMSALAFSFIALCGFGAAAMVSTPWAIADLAHGGQVDRRAAMVLTFATTAGSVGALVGGFFGGTLGWRWAFAPSLLLLVAMLVLSRTLPKVPLPRGQSIDWIGGLLSFLGFGSILVGVSLGGEFGWWTPRREFSIAGIVLPPFAVSIVPTLLAAGAIALGLFAFWQRLGRRSASDSLLRAGLLRKPVFLIATLASMLHALIVTGVQFNLFQFLPVTAELTPLQTALAVTPYPATTALVTIGTKTLRLRRWLSVRAIALLGMALEAAGIAAIFASAHLRVDWPILFAGLIVMGIGSGCFLSTIGDLAYSAATPDEKPEGTAIFYPGQNLGNALGRALLGSLLVLAASRNVVDTISAELGKTLDPARRSDLIFRLQEMIQTMPRPELAARALAHLPKPELVYQIERQAAASGLRVSLIAALAIVALCLLITRLLPAQAPEA